MVVHIRIEMTEEMMQAFKEQMGVNPTRKAVVATATKLLTHAIYPDGPPKKKKQKFTLRG